MCVLALAALLAGRVPAEARPRVLASRKDATISYDSASDAWTIGGAEIAVMLGLDRDQQLLVQRVWNPLSGRLLLDTPASDTTLRLNGQSMALAEGATGFHYEGATAETWQGGVHLTFAYTHRALRVRVVRHYACYPGSPLLETWTSAQVEAGGEPLTVSNIVGWQLSVRPGTVRWINGLRGDAPDTPVDDAFSIGSQDLAPGEAVTLSAHRRSSERFIPFVMVDNGADTWFGGVQWSGMWKITCTRRDETLDVSVEFPDVTTTVTDARPLEVPHSFFGSWSGGSGTVSAALRQFLMTGIRQGRPIRPLVTYNTWYPYGSRIDEATMLDEINRTAALGIELFVLDAGWYQGAGVLDFYDFDTGLGTWTPDPERFPNGLQPLADFARKRGMKFGLWVEPGRVSLDTVGVEGLAHEEWLAQYNGRNVTATSGQICYGSRAAREWVKQQLFALIDAVHPDYLKWDNNAWINCNRSDHDHGPGDGNFAQVQGLYALWQSLRDRYPDLILENVSDGGSRIDFGALRYTDAAWMDDRTAPAVQVRHNLEGLSALFPAGYLLSFVIDSRAEPLVQSSDPIAELRSRMPGVLGFAYRSPGLATRTAEAFAGAIADYSRFRDILQNADAFLLSDQAPRAGAWDVLEERNASTGDAVLFAYQQPDAPDRILVRLRGLQAEARYAVESLDVGALGTVSGDELMRDGIEIVQGDGSSAHIIVMRKQ